MACSFQSFFEYRKANNMPTRIRYAQALDISCLPEPAMIGIADTYDKTSLTDNPTFRLKSWVKQDDSRAVGFCA
jgi:hypothetical protein